MGFEIFLMVTFFSLSTYNTFDTPPQMTSKEIYEYNKQNNPMNVQPDDDWDGAVSDKNPFTEVMK
jgi:hypothetical protein